MQYNAKTPQEYLNSLETDWRKEKLEQVRDLILKNNPELKEGIEFKMLCYQLDGETVFNLNAQKHYVALYTGNIDKIEEGRQLLKEFDLGKGFLWIFF
ncbi:MAG: DUF1801 domain-containing protein [Chloroflexia bacterium]|nr:DUF1801 domain-containing protein [Chloroflexia bacterium]